MTIFKAELPRSGTLGLAFFCKLCGKRVKELPMSSGGQFTSRYQHLEAKHRLSVHEFFKTFYHYGRPTNEGWTDEF